MKILTLALSLLCVAPGCLADGNFEAYVKNGKPGPWVITADAGAPHSNFVLPQLQEFYVPLQTYSTAGGAIFGSIKRQNNKMKAYWQSRQAELNNENEQCLGLQGDENIKECLGNVRQTEIRKSETIAQYNQQHVSQQYAQSLYRQQALQNFSNQLKQAPQRFRTPTTTNCNSTGYGYGVSTNCTTY